MYHYSQFKNFLFFTLADVAQWIEHRPVNQRVASSIPGQGTCLDYRPGHWVGASERQRMGVSLTLQCCCPSFSLSLPLSLKIHK